MRISHPTATRALARFALVVALVAVGCGGAGGSPAPTTPPTPAPTATPDPHLSDPASVDAVFVWLNGRGLTVIGNNADRGASGEPIKRINATYAGWPLVLSQYSSSAAARKASGVKPGTSRPGPDEAPFTFLGLNVVVEFGPRLGGTHRPAPDARFLAAATSLAAALDPLLGPLGIRSVAKVALPSPSPRPAAGSASSSPKPTAKPAATATPST